MRIFSARANIAASPEMIWAILTDAAAYPSWNTAVDWVEGRIEAGRKVTVRANLGPGIDLPVTVAELDPPRKMVWTGGMPLGLFKGTRTFTLTPRDGHVVFTMTEVFDGLLSPLIEKSLPDLQPSFDEFAACLKRRAEQSS